MSGNEASSKKRSRIAWRCFSGSESKQCLNWRLVSFCAVVSAGDASSAGRFGKGVMQDFTESAKWFRKAAEQEDAPAQFNLGYCYEHGQGVPQNYTEAVKWYCKAAGQGHIRAQEFLGACYANGRAAIDVENAGEVYKWVKLAEEHGCEGAAKTAAVIEALLSPEEFREAERGYSELMASR